MHSEVLCQWGPCCTLVCYITNLRIGVPLPADAVKLIFTVQ